MKNAEFVVSRVNKFGKISPPKRWKRHHFFDGNREFHVSRSTVTAKKYGIEIEEDKVEYSEEKKHQTERELFYKIHEVANTFFFSRNSLGNEEGKIGLSISKNERLR